MSATPLTEIARTLRTAREGKGLSQRALSKRSGLTQTQISKVENAADARLSSLIELARALDLEVALVPRKTVPAVQSIVRSAAADLPARETAKVLRELSEAALALSELAPDVEDAQRLKTIANDVQKRVLWPNDLTNLRRSVGDLRRIAKIFEKSSGTAVAYDILDVRQRLQEIAENRRPRDENDGRSKPAYSLDEDDADG